VDIIGGDLRYHQATQCSTSKNERYAGEDDSHTKYLKRNLDPPGGSRLLDGKGRTEPEAKTTKRIPLTMKFVFMIPE